MPSCSMAARSPFERLDATAAKETVVVSVRLPLPQYNSAVPGGLSPIGKAVEAMAPTALDEAMNSLDGPDTFSERELQELKKELLDCCKNEGLSLDQKVDQRLTKLSRITNLNCERNLPEFGRRGAEKRVAKLQALKMQLNGQQDLQEQHVSRAWLGQVVWRFPNRTRHTTSPPSKLPRSDACYRSTS